MRKSILVRELHRLYAMAFEICAEGIKSINYQQMEILKEGISRKNSRKQNITLIGKYVCVCRGVDLIWQVCRIISPFRISVFVLNSFILYSYSIIHSSNITGYLICARLCYLALGILCFQGIYDSVQQTNNQIFIQVN